MSMTETINKIEQQQTLRTTAEKRILGLFYEQSGAWHDDGTMVMEDDFVRELIADVVELFFNTMYVPKHLRDIPYGEIAKQATAHAIRHGWKESD